MANLNNYNLKLAIQKQGRLTDETLLFLRNAGLEFESYKQKLFSVCRNFPLEILYVRDDDIPDYVASGNVSLGIVGQNILNEERPMVKKLLNLRYGLCTLVVAVPKDATVNSLTDLSNKTIATSYPVSTKNFFEKKKIPVKIVQINGSVEITPSLGIADAIVDLTSSGSTLALNDLIILERIYDSEAILIANKNAMQNAKGILIEKLMTRLRGVLSAKNYKYIMMNAPKTIIPKIKKIVPGLKSPTIAPLANTDLVSIQSVVKEDVFWETVEKLHQYGASGIIVLPIEKILFK